MMYLFGHGLSLLINHETSIWLRNLPGFLWFPMANRWIHFIRNLVCPDDVPVWPWLIPADKSRDVYLVAQFTWFLLVSYGQPVVTLHQKLGMPLRCTCLAHGLSLLINHETSIWLRNLLAFLWFPIANRWLHFIRNSVCPYDVPVWPWPIPAYKSLDVHLVAQFTWFLVVSYGQPAVTLHQKLGMPL
jgi:hypothetical protein